MTEQRLDTGSNGLTRQYVYDQSTMRLTTLRAGVSSPYTNLQNLSYTYDAVGNVASIVDGVNSSQRQCFGYDALDRLTNAFTGNSDCTAYTAGGTGPYNHSYVYDAIGNLTSYAGNTYTYGDSAHKHAVTSAYGNSYGYDGNGNQTSRTIGGVAYTFTFDYENRLTEVKQDTTTLATFLYDADGNRVKGTVSGVTTVYVAGIYEYQGGATTKYYEGGGLRRSGYSTNNGVFYMLSDHLKSTSALVARNGVLNVKYFYYPYGARRGVPFNTITAKHFTGQYHETSLPGGEGLSYYGARWYDPRLGRFLSADTIVPSASNPQDLNRYTYARNNALRYTDPTGHYIFAEDPGTPYRPPKPVKSVPPTKLWKTTGYGTLDSSHWNAGNPAQVIKDTRTAILAGGGQVTVRGGVIGAEHSTSYLVSSDASIYDAKSIALGIYMDWSYKFEEWEGHVWGWFAGRGTRFAMEDLPTHYLSFVAAATGMSRDQVLGYLAPLTEPDEQPPRGYDEPNETFLPMVQDAQGAYVHGSWPSDLTLTPAASGPDTWQFQGETSRRNLGAAIQGAWSHYVAPRLPDPWVPLPPPVPPAYFACPLLGC